MATLRASVMYGNKEINLLSQLFVPFWPLVNRLCVLIFWRVCVRAFVLITRGHAEYLVHSLEVTSFTTET